MKEGKVWGTTRTVHADDSVSIHHASVMRGKRCSRHVHVHRANGFYVVSGQISVRVFHESGIEDVTVLKAGDAMTIPAGVEHRFETPDDECELVEFYLPMPVHVADIVRRDEGGAL